MSICKKHTKQLVAHAAVTHTYCIRSSQRKDKKYVTSVPAQPQDKFNFFFPSLLCLNFFAIACRHQNRWTEIAKTITYIDLTRTKDRRPAYNSTYNKLAVQWLNEPLCLVSGSVLADSFVLRKRQLLVAANRQTV